MRYFIYGLETINPSRALRIIIIIIFMIVLYILLLYIVYNNVLHIPNTYYMNIILYGPLQSCYTLRTNTAEILYARNIIIFCNYCVRTI